MKLYLIIAICAIVCGAYFYGVNITNAKCKTQYLQKDLQNTQQIQINKKVIHEKVYKTGVDDIRSILFDKYTIAE
jgi:hypothetical protein